MQVFFKDLLELDKICVFDSVILYIDRGYMRELFQKFVQEIDALEALAS